MEQGDLLSAIPGTSADCKRSGADTRPAHSAVIDRGTEDVVLTSAPPHPEEQHAPEPSSFEELPLLDRGAP